MATPNAAAAAATSEAEGSPEPDVISPAVIHGLSALDRTGVLRCEPT